MEALHTRDVDVREPSRIPPPVSDEVRAHLLAAALQRGLAALYRSRRLLSGLVLLVAAASVGITLMMPNVYEARARVLAPDASSSLLSSFLGNSTASMARRFLGSGTSVGTYTRPLAILTSRTVNEAVMDSFGLVRVYEFEGAKGAREKTLEELEARTFFGVDEQLEFLTISVRDESPQRAAAMTNLYVRLLNRTNSALSTENARSYRAFIQERYDLANQAVDSLLDAAAAFQRRYGVIDLPAQTQAYYTQMGALRAEQARLQVQLRALRSELGPEAPAVQAAEQALAEATRQYQAALNGAEAALPVARGAVPTVAREYAQLERERIMQTAALEVLGPMYEAARMEEGRQVETVQVLDLAVPPSRKVAPKRSLIVVASVLSAFLLGVAFVLAQASWRRHRGAIVAWMERADARAT